MRKLAQGEFIKRAREVHGDFYGYGDTQYRRSRSKVTIECPVHGSFVQNPRTHLMGYGCLICSGKKHSREDFIKRARNVHGDRYDYSNLVYRGVNTKLSITCRVHGSFEQNGAKHLAGCGCPGCFGIERATFEDFLGKAREVHGDTYDYALVKYRYRREKVKIICKKHGVFEMTPSNHYYGQGCPICNESGGEREVRRLLEELGLGYRINEKFEGCKNKRHLMFDFYLPEHNVCIEYDGIQHKESVAFFGGEEAFKRRKKRDRIKDRFCVKNSIPLIRVCCDKRTISQRLMPELKGLQTNIGEK